MVMFDEVITLEKYSSVKKDVKKYSAAKPNQETSLAQVIQKNEEADCDAIRQSYKATNLRLLEQKNARWEIQKK